MRSIINKPVSEEHEYCTVVFRLNGGRAEANGFIYALACCVEQLKYAEVVTLQMGDLLYQPATSVSGHGLAHAPAPQGVDDEQP